MRLDHLTSVGADRRGKFAVVAMWLLAAGALIGTAPRLSSVTDPRQGQQLPSGTDSQIAAAILQRDFPATRGVPAIIVLTDPAGLNDADRARANQLGRWLTSASKPPVVSLVVSPSTPQAGAQLISADGTTEIVIAILSGSPSDVSVHDAVVEIRGYLSNLTKGSSVQGHVTGPAGVVVDAVEIFKTVDLRLVLTTIGLVLVLLIVLYRSPLLAFLPLLAVGLAMQVANALIADGARAGWLSVSPMAANIATVLLFGAGTDYGIFIAARFREELGRGADKHAAMRATMRAVGSAITSSAATVILGLLSLLLAAIALYYDLAAVLAITIAVMLLVGLTLVPALLTIFGRAAFWPFVPRPASELPNGRVGLWPRVGRLVARRPGLCLAASAMLLAVLALGNLGSQPSFSFLSAFRTATDSSAGYSELRQHFPAGDLAPTTVLVVLHGTNPAVAAHQSQIEQITAVVGRVSGVAQVLPAGVSTDGRAAQFTTIFRDDPYGLPAIERIPNIRSAARQAAAAVGLGPVAPTSAEIHAAGQTAELADTQALNRRDTDVVVPVVLFLVAVILGLLLRSLIAPLYLLAAVTLNFFATLGLSSFLVQRVLGQDGLNWAIPLYSFVFLVALGADYTIFLMARIREEGQRRELRVGVPTALARTGGVITSAGLILAGTFAVLTTLPLTLLMQLGLTVAIGILLDTIVVRGFMVPSIVLLLGSWSWCPSALLRRHQDERFPALRKETAAGG